MQNLEYEQLFKEVKKAQDILIVGHRKPDGDALGSMCAMKIWLDKMGKRTDLGCVDKPTRKYSFLPHIENVKKNIDPNDYELVILLDCGAHYMTDFHEKYPEILSFNNPNKRPFIVNIDHHASNDMFGHLNIVETESASATMIIFKIFSYIDTNITPDIATCLLTGIYNDTGSFMHSNTSLEVYQVAAELLGRGAKVAPIIKALFKTNTLSSLKLLGKAFSKAEITKDNFICSVITEEEARGDDGRTDQLSGAVDYLNMVPGVDFALLVQEDRKSVKGSFRTRKDNVDLSEIAKKYGGGGHPKAAGFTMDKASFNS
jgi:bifunctional oligoribonuclease and PAP phosphatase NrnA